MSSEEQNVQVEASGEAASPTASQEVKREIVEFVKMIAWFLIVFFIVKQYVVEGYEVQGPSMIPTLRDRERILVFKLPHILSQYNALSAINALKEGDIVVFDSLEPNKRYVKRVIAKGPHKPASNAAAAKQEGSDAAPEDGVHVKFDRGAVYVNNRRILEDYLVPEQKVSEDVCPTTIVPPGGYYVLGDNRNVSKDSRSFGPIDDSRVVGKAVLCFWPPSKIRLL